MDTHSTKQNELTSKIDLCASDEGVNLTERPERFDHNKYSVENCKGLVTEDFDDDGNSDYAIPVNITVSNVVHGIWLFDSSDEMYKKIGEVTEQPRKIGKNTISITYKSGGQAWSTDTYHVSLQGLNQLNHSENLIQEFEPISSSPTTQKELLDKKNQTTGKAIRLIYPNGGEVWYEGQTYEIRWEAHGINKAVISVATGGKNKGDEFIDIESSQGIYSWRFQIPKGYITGFGVSKAVMRIKAWDYENPDVYDYSDGNFTIKGTD